MNFAGSKWATTIVFNGNKPFLVRGSLRSLWKKQKHGTSFKSSHYGQSKLNVMIGCSTMNNDMSPKWSISFGTVSFVEINIYSTTTLINSFCFLEVPRTLFCRWDKMKIMWNWKCHRLVLWGLSLISGVRVVIGWVAWWGSSFLEGIVTFYVAVWRVQRAMPPPWTERVFLVSFCIWPCLSGLFVSM